MLVTYVYTARTRTVNTPHGDRTERQLRVGTVNAVTVDDLVALAVANAGDARFRFEPPLDVSLNHHAFRAADPKRRGRPPKTRPADHEAPVQGFAGGACRFGGGGAEHHHAARRPRRS